jgi:hypothetical protein
MHGQNRSNVVNLKTCLRGEPSRLFHRLEQNRN